MYHEGNEIGCCIQLGPQSVAGQNIKHGHMHMLGNNSFTKRRMCIAVCLQQFVASELRVEQVLLV